MQPTPQLPKTKSFIFRLDKVSWKTRLEIQPTLPTEKPAHAHTQVHQEVMHIQCLRGNLAWRIQHNGRGTSCQAKKLLYLLLRGSPPMPPLCQRRLTWNGGDPVPENPKRRFRNSSAFPRQHRRVSKNLHLQGHLMGPYLHVLRGGKKRHGDESGLGQVYYVWCSSHSVLRDRETSTGHLCRKLQWF